MIRFLIYSLMQLEKYWVPMFNFTLPHPSLIKGFLKGHKQCTLQKST